MMWLTQLNAQVSDGFSNGFDTYFDISLPKSNQIKFITRAHFKITGVDQSAVQCKYAKQCAHRVKETKHNGYKE